MTVIYLSVLSVFEKQDYIALDIALSLNLLPEIMTVLNGKIITGEKTLTGDEIEAAAKSALKKITKTLGAEIRS